MAALSVSKKSTTGPPGSLLLLHLVCALFPPQSFDSIYAYEYIMDAHACVGCFGGGFVALFWLFLENKPLCFPRSVRFLLRT
uniref:Uncharacterized protein n=1 Tax=Rhipicephalus zambeziensis TaxID=60191 RepID=A0A224YLN7_9ACAR